MTDPVPSNICPGCECPDGDHYDWCTPQAREQRPSKDLSELYQWLIDKANDSDPYDSQMFTKAMTIVGDRLAPEPESAPPPRPYGETVAPDGPWRVVHYGSPPQKGDSIFDADGCIAYFGDQHHDAVSRIVYEHNITVSALPPHLSDPMQVLERGRQIEESGGLRLAQPPRDGQ